MYFAMSKYGWVSRRYSFFPAFYLFSGFWKLRKPPSVTNSCIPKHELRKIIRGKRVFLLWFLISRPEETACHETQTPTEVDVRNVLDRQDWTTCLPYCLTVCLKFAMFNGFISFLCRHVCPVKSKNIPYLHIHFPQCLWRKYLKVFDK